MEAAEGKAVVRVLACVLEKLASSNDSDDNFNITKFHALRTPAISIHDYLERMRATPVGRKAVAKHSCVHTRLTYFDEGLEHVGNAGLDWLSVWVVSSMPRARASVLCSLWCISTASFSGTSAYPRRP